MTKNSLKNYSLIEIEACLAKALGDLVGHEVRVSIAGINHPVPHSVPVWSGRAAWTAEFGVSAAEVLPPEKSIEELLG